MPDLCRAEKETRDSPPPPFSEKKMHDEKKKGRQENADVFQVFFKYNVIDDPAWWMCRACDESNFIKSFEILGLSGN